MAFKKGNIPWNNGKPWPEEIKQKFKKAWDYEKHFTEESLKNMSLAQAGRKHKEETKRKIAKAVSGKNNGLVKHPEKNPMRNPESRRKLGKINKIVMNTPERIDCSRKNRLHQVFPQKDTSIEIKIQDALKLNNINFQKHKPILGQPDIFIEPNICVFADGCYWHDCPMCSPNGGFRPDNNRDEEVNKTLRKNGYIVLRFWEHEINNNAEECIDKIKEVLN